MPETYQSRRCNPAHFSVSIRGPIYGMDVCHMDLDSMDSGVKMDDDDHDHNCIDDCIYGCV